jgi:hypothetical protein
MGTFTPQDVITEVRRLVQDTKVSYRYSDDHMLGVFNQALKRTCLLRPDLFATIETMTCAEGPLQSAPSSSVRIIDIIRSLSSGSNLNEVSRDTLDLMYDNWQNDTEAAATNWMRHVRNPNQFFVYPPSPVGQQLIIEYAKSPSNLAITDVVTTLPDAYFPVLVDACVWLIESVDNEHINSGRAKLFQESFIQGLGVTIQAKKVTDDPSGGEDKVVV